RAAGSGPGGTGASPTGTALLPGRDDQLLRADADAGERARRGGAPRPDADRADHRGARPPRVPRIPDRPPLRAHPAAAPRRRRVRPAAAGRPLSLTLSPLRGARGPDFSREPRRPGSFSLPRLRERIFLP